MTLAEELANNNILLVTTTKDKYREALERACLEIEKSANKIGYITINRPYSALMETFSRCNINKSKFYFVDAITATVQAPQAVDNCLFVSSPTALTDLGLAFSSMLSEKKCDVILFDTISTLIIYQDLASVLKFVHNLVTKVRVMNKKAILIALRDDGETLIKDLNMFVDKIIEL